ncbi:MAG: protein kinase [Terrimesophilobacter sp.]
MERIITIETGSGENRGTLLRGRYRLEDVIGVGGMAAVYRARDELLERDVAVKVFRARARDQVDIDRQENEIKLLSSLSHHSLVNIIDAGAHLADPEKPRLFLVMELVPGEDLRIRLKNGTLTPRQIAEIGSDLAEGLEYLAHVHVVHRDITPANILIVDYSGKDTRPRAKLTDFGIATKADLDPTAPGYVTSGTAPYLSPEQASRKPVGAPSDVYALGLVLLECFTGERAFPGSDAAAVGARLYRNPEIPDSLSDEWRALLAAMTARNPLDRPPLREIILILRDLLAVESRRHSAAPSPFQTDDTRYEAARMEAVRRYDVLDTPPDGAFDRVTAMAARMLRTPIAIVSIVDHDRIWFKSHHGLEIDSIDREPGLCASAILGEEPWVINDARTDPRALANPLVAGEFGLQFYAGVPLRSRDGYNLGTLCVIDFEPRVVTEDELATLTDLAAVVTNELDLRLDSRLAVRSLGGQVT